MIIVSFRYKENIVATRRVDMLFTLSNCAEVRKLISLDMIKKPEKFDCFELTKGSNE